MRKLDLSFIGSTVQMPLKRGSLQHLQEGWIEMFLALASGIAEANPDFTFNTPIAIWGARNTGAGNTYIISKGAILYQDDIYLVDAFTGTISGNAIIATITETFTIGATYDPVQFSDGSSHNIHSIKKVVFSLGASGSGTFDYSSIKRKSEVSIAVGAVGAPAFQNGWINEPVYAGGPLVFCRKGNRVIINGTINHATNIGGVIFTLPVGYRPLVIKYLVGAAIGPVYCNMIVNPDGTVALTSYFAGGNTIFFTSNSFDLDF